MKSTMKKWPNVIKAKVHDAVITALRTPIALNGNSVRNASWNDPTTKTHGPPSNVQYAVYIEDDQEPSRKNGDPSFVHLYNALGSPQLINRVCFDQW